MLEKKWFEIEKEDGLSQPNHQPPHPHTQPRNSYHLWSGGGMEGDDSQGITLLGFNPLRGIELPRKTSLRGLSKKWTDSLAFPLRVGTDLFVVFG
jgi:hypothetical protein